MKRTITSFIFILMLAACFGQVVQAEDGWILVWRESFEEDALGAHPSNWTIHYSHNAELGPRVVDESVVPMVDGHKALRMYEKTEGIVSRISREFDPIEVGRIVIYAMVHDSDQRGQVNLDLNVGSNRLVGISLERDGSLVWRDEFGDRQTAYPERIYLPRGVWHKLEVEWNVHDRVFHAYYYDGDGNRIAFTPPEGGPMVPWVLEAPSNVRFQTGSHTPNEGRIAYIDAIEVYRKAD